MAMLPPPTGLGATPPAAGSTVTVPAPVPGIPVTTIGGAQGGGQDGTMFPSWEAPRAVEPSATLPAAGLTNIIPIAMPTTATMPTMPTMPTTAMPTAPISPAFPSASGISSPAPAPDAPHLPNSQADLDFIGRKICIYGPSLQRKTTSLRNLGADGRKVWMADVNGNSNSIRNLITRPNWTITRPITFQGLVNDVVAQAANADVLIFDHGTAIQALYTSHWLGQDTATAGALWNLFSNKVKRPGQFDYVDLAFGFGLFVRKTLEFAARENGGKDVVWIFQLGSDQSVEKGGTGKQGPDATGRLTRDLPTFFDAVFPVVLLQPQGASEASAYFQTRSSGQEFAGHRFNVNDDGRVKSILEDFEPADVAMLFEKIAKVGY